MWPIDQAAVPRLATEKGSLRRHIASPVPSSCPRCILEKIRLAALVNETNAPLIRGPLSLTERRPSSAAGSFRHRLESLIFQSTSLQCARRSHSNVRTGSSLSCHGIAGPRWRGWFDYYNELSSPLGLLAHWGSRSCFSLLLPPPPPFPPPPLGSLALSPR